MSETVLFIYPIFVIVVGVILSFVVFANTLPCICGSNKKCYWPLPVYLTLILPELVMDSRVSRANIKIFAVIVVLSFIPWVCQIYQHFKANKEEK